MCYNYKCILHFQFNNRHFNGYFAKDEDNDDYVPCPSITVSLNAHQ